MQEELHRITEEIARELQGEIHRVERLIEEESRDYERAELKVYKQTYQNGQLLATMLNKVVELAEVQDRQGKLLLALQRQCNLISQSIGSLGRK